MSATGLRQQQQQQQQQQQVLAWDISLVGSFSNLDAGFRLMAAYRYNIIACRISEVLEDMAS